MKQLIKVIIAIVAVLSFPSSRGWTQSTSSTKLKSQTYTNWETKYDEYDFDAEYYELTIPNFFRGKDAVTVQLYHYGTESNYPNSTISLIDAEGNLLTTIFEPTQFHKTALRHTTLSVADIDGNGLKDIKIEFSYMGNGLMAYAIRTIYIFQEKNITFNKISFDSFVCKGYVSEIDIDRDGKHEIVAKTLEYADENNRFWVENLYKYTPEGLICISEANGYPKATSVKQNKPAKSEVLAKHKKEWTLLQPQGYHFLKSTDPEADIYTSPQKHYTELKNVKWTKYVDKKQGYTIEYPAGFEPTAVGSLAVEFGNMFSVSIKPLSAEDALVDSPDKILKSRYEVLSSDMQWVTTKRLNGKLYGYADFYGIDHPNVKSRAVAALCIHSAYVYEFYCENPDDKSVEVFLEILSRFQITQK